jgi:hypothetical protein
VGRREIGRQGDGALVAFTLGTEVGNRVGLRDGDPVGKRVERLVGRRVVD